MSQTGYRSVASFASVIAALALPAACASPAGTPQGPAGGNGGDGGQSAEKPDAGNPNTPPLSGGNGGTGGAIVPDAGGAMADSGLGGAPDPSSLFPDDGLPRDKSYTAGAIPLPASTMDIPELLSQTGLYADTATGVFAYDVRLFKPQFELWTDGAVKRRFIYLPEGQQIDTSDMDNWAFPVGTKLWKEFVRDGTRIETRLIWRIREGGRGWISIAYVWNDDQTDAVAAPMGLVNAKQTAHDVPGVQACNSCHNERPDRPLGFSAVQLSYDGPGLDLSELIERELLTHPPVGNFTLPGTPVEQEVLGYLHGNCGHCHRAESSAAVRGDLRTWLLVDQLGDVKTTDTFTYLVNREVFAGTSVNPIRIVGGAPDKSEVLRRMQLVMSMGRMPPLGTEDVDPTGVNAVTEWVKALPAP